jgi:hypothetical protein
MGENGKEGQEKGRGKENVREKREDAMPDMKKAYIEAQ